LGEKILRKDRESVRPCQGQVKKKGHYPRNAQREKKNGTTDSKKRKIIGGNKRPREKVWITHRSEFGSRTKKDSFEQPRVRLKKGHRKKKIKTANGLGHTKKKAGGGVVKKKGGVVFH